MENQTTENQGTENVEFVEPVAAAPAAEPKKKKGRLAFLKRTPKWVVISVPLLALALFAYNGGYLKNVGSKAGETIAKLTPSFGTSAPAQKAADKLAMARDAFAAGDINGAVAGYREIIAANPNDIAARGELGNVLYTVGAVSEASQSYFEAASLAIEQNQIEVAEALFPAIIEGNPMLASALNDKLFDAQVRTHESERMQSAQKQALQQPQRQG